MAGGGPIQYNDLYAKNVQDGIKELNSLTAQTDALFQELATTITATSGRVTSSLKTETTALQQLKETLVAVDVTQKGAADSLNKAAIATDTATVKTRNLKDQQEGLTKIQAASNAELTRLQERTQALTKEYELLAASTDKNDKKLKALSKEITATVTAQNRLASAMGISKKAIDAAEGSYNQMNNELLKLKKELKEMPNAIDKQTGAWNKNNPAVREHLRLIQLQDATIKKFDATLGNHQRNVGNYSSALSGAANQITSLVSGYVSVAAALGAIGATFSMAVKTDAIRSSLEFIFKSTDIADQKLNMLQQTAERLGLNFVELADSYKSFIGAATASNFPLKEAERIFNAVANAGSRLKLSSDQMSGAMMALQQMISKGTVQAEELRGQLGERLPGAFAIAARAMGVTEQRLAKMMKDGDVLAADLLPKLAAELDKTFGGGTDEKVNSLQGSVNRLKNTFSEMVSGNTSISKFFQALIDGVTGASNAIAKTVNSSSFKEFLLRMSALGGGVTGALAGAAADAENFKNTNNRNDIVKQSILSQFGKSDKAGQQQMIADAQYVRDRALGVAQKTGKADDNLFYVKQAKVLQNLKQAWDQLYNAKKPVVELDEKEEKKVEKQLNELEKLEKKLKDLKDVMVMGRLKDKNFTNAMIEQVIGDLQDQLDFALTGREKEIPGLKASFDLTAGIDQSNTIVGARGKIEKQPGYVKSWDQRMDELKASLSQLMPFLRESNQLIGEIFGQEFGNLFDQLTTDIENFATTGKLSFEDLANTAVASIRSIDESYQIGTENRIKALELEKQTQVDIAGTNAVARLAIEKEYNDKIRAEKRKQAQIDKISAAFEIAINTAVAVSKTTAQTGLFGIPLIPIIIALGAAQLAAVIARPIPQFRHGTQSAPGGLAEVAEDGPEAIQSPSGHLRIAHKRQITFLEKGSKVFTADETRKMIDIQQIERTVELHSRLTKNLQDGRRQEQINTMAAAFYASRISEDKLASAMGREVAKLPLQSISMDERGFTRHLQTSTTRTKILNERFSLK